MFDVVDAAVLLRALNLKTELLFSSVGFLDCSGEDNSIKEEALEHWEGQASERDGDVDAAGSNAGDSSMDTVRCGTALLLLLNLNMAAILGALYPETPQT